MKKIMVALFACGSSLALANGQTGVGMGAANAAMARPVFVRAPALSNGQSGVVLSAESTRSQAPVTKPATATLPKPEQKVGYKR